MHTIILLCLAGGLLSVLTFIHFFVDWIFQSHAEAMVKHNNWKIRAKHCAIYTVGFVPLLVVIFLHGFLTPWELAGSFLILFISHFCEDTYLPVYYWALTIRRPPPLRWKIKLVDGKGKLFDPEGKESLPPDSVYVGETQVPLGETWRHQLAASVTQQESYYDTYRLLDAANKTLHMRGFGEFVETTIGKILMIAIDQIIHITFLIPIVYFVLSHLPFFLK